MPDLIFASIGIFAFQRLGQVIGLMKGKSAIHIARFFGVRTLNFTVEHLWALGHFVFTVGRDETVIRE